MARDPLEGYRPKLDDLTADESELAAAEAGADAAGISQEQIRRCRLGMDAELFVTGDTNAGERSRIGVFLYAKARATMESFLEVVLVFGMDHPRSRAAFDEAKGAGLMLGWLDGAIVDYHQEKERIEEDER